MTNARAALALGGLGVALGLFSWLGDRLPPEPGGPTAVIVTLASLPGPWLVVAFLAGALAGRPIRGVVAGLLTLGLAVGVYYVARGLTDGLLIAWPVIFWLVVAVAAGPVFGLAGGTWRAERPRWSPAGIGLLGGTLLGEAALLAADANPFNPFFIGLPAFVVAAVEAICGIAAPLSLAADGERWLAAGVTAAAALGGVVVTVALF